MLSMLPLHLAIVPVSCSLFQKKGCLVPVVLSFIQKFLTEFLCSIAFKNVQTVHQNRNHSNPCLHQIIDIKPSSDTKQCTFSIWKVSK